jgi:hypothetical protein
MISSAGSSDQTRQPFVGASWDDTDFRLSKASWCSTPSRLAPMRFGPAYLLEDQVKQQLAAGKLVRVLAD